MAFVDRPSIRGFAKPYLHCYALTRLELHATLLWDFGTGGNFRMCDCSTKCEYRNLIHTEVEHGLGLGLSLSLSLARFYDHCYRILRIKGRFGEDFWSVCRYRSRYHTCTCSSDKQMYFREQDRRCRVSKEKEIWEIRFWRKIWKYIILWKFENSKLERSTVFKLQKSKVG